MGTRKIFLGTLFALGMITAAALPARAANVVVFDDPVYVGTGGGSGDESDNIQASIASFGHTVSTIPGITEADFANGLAGQDVLVFPEFENADPTPDLSPEAVAAINGFVNSGGRVVINSTDGSEYLDGFFPLVFGFSADETDGSAQLDTNKTPAAAGTVFQNGPDMLSYNNGTAGLVVATFPADAASIYDEGTVSYVAIIPVGMGEVIFLGYDWFNSDPPNAGGQDNGWQGILAAALADADLAITKTASPTLVDVDENITYTLTVTNNGPNDAINVNVTDNLPAGVSLVSATPSQGACTGTGPVDCDLDGLANGASATIALVVTADISGDLTNQAEVSGAMIDPDLSNNSAEASVTVVNPPPPPLPNLLSGAGCNLASGADVGIFPIGGWLLALAGLGVLRRRTLRR